jgi:hypothetical protein
MHYLSSVYFVSQPLHVSGISVAHYQEVHCCLYNKFIKVVFITRMYQDAGQHNIKVINKLDKI